MNTCVTESFKSTSCAWQNRYCK